MIAVKGTFAKTILVVYSRRASILKTRILVNTTLVKVIHVEITGNALKMAVNMYVNAVWVGLASFATKKIFVTGRFAKIMELVKMEMPPFIATAQTTGLENNVNCMTTVIQILAKMVVTVKIC